MRKGKAYRIPFVTDKNGTSSMMEYTAQHDPTVVAIGEYGYYSPTEWRDNIPFRATLQITGTWRGRSAARVGLTSTTCSYSMGFAAFHLAVKSFGVAPGGAITGEWMFRKQGANYGLYPVVEG